MRRGWFLITFRALGGETAHSAVSLSKQFSCRHPPKDIAGLLQSFLAKLSRPRGAFHLLCMRRYQGGTKDQFPATQKWYNSNSRVTTLPVAIATRDLAAVARSFGVIVTVPVAMAVIAVTEL